jgi:hypothetical protein
MKALTGSFELGFISRRRGQIIAVTSILGLIQNHPGLHYLFRQLAAPHHHDMDSGDWPHNQAQLRCQGAVGLGSVDTRSQSQQISQRHPGQQTCSRRKHASLPLGPGQRMSREGRGFVRG